MIESVGSGCTKAAPPPEPKLYVLVRRDLPWPVRTVQATHAAMQLLQAHNHSGPSYCIRCMDWGPHGPAVVLLGVDTELTLASWLAKLAGAVGFREPDLCDALTAVAWYGEAPAELSELRLM